MSLYAYKSHQERIAAIEAAPRTDYRCMECGERVRIRRPREHRRPHFFHLQKSSLCRQSGKSEEHFQIQSWILRHLPSSAAMEVFFPAIRRVADIIWERERIIFEVQCSPISAWEVARRTFDYRSQGWRVIWLLKESVFFHEGEEAPAGQWLEKWGFAYFRYASNVEIEWLRKDAEGNLVSLPFEDLPKRKTQPSPPFSLKKALLFPFKTIGSTYSFFFDALLSRFCR